MIDSGLSPVVKLVSLYRRPGRLTLSTHRREIMSGTAVSALDAETVAAAGIRITSLKG